MGNFKSHKKEIVTRVYRIFYMFFTFKWRSFFKLYNKKSDTIVWLNIYGPMYFMRVKFIRDLGIILGLINSNQDFKIVTGKKIGSYFNKTIFFTMNDSYNVFGFKNYVSILEHIITRLENQNNKVFPKLEEANYWENKAFMHRRFEELDINTPQTILLKRVEDIDNAELKMPFLIKAEHSCSAKGVFKIDNKEELKELLEETDFLKENKTIIVQKLLNIKRDLRVIVVGDKIVLHYWRINNDDEWKPTSTSFGSTVDFVMFPEKWRTYILETFKKLKITTGAFDFAWENDDLETEPLVLEVSSSYSPNPKVNPDSKLSYGEYKHTIKYDREYVKIVYEIQNEYIKASLID